MDSTEAGYEALRSSAAAVWIDRDVIEASGPDATGYLQGQLSQDVAGLEVGASAWSWILQPAGKVDALLRVSRLEPDRFLLDTDGGSGEALLARLNRYKLRTKVTFEPLAWNVLAVRGPDVAGLDPAALAPSAGVVVADASWPGWPGVDLLGAAVTVPSSASGEVPIATIDAYEAARIEAGVPAMGAELTERTIPAETGLVERTVSFTKGCYTGQELVARIDSRGSNVARHLRGIRLDQAAERGATLEAEGKEVGVLTSVAHSPALGWVALAYVRRAIEPPAIVQVCTGAPDQTRASAGVETLPLR